MKSLSLSFCVVVSIVGALTAAAVPAQTYDLAADWNEGPNPNGVWSYRQGGVPLGHLASWVPGGFPTVQPAYANAAVGAGHIPAAMKLVATTIGLDLQAGDVMMHSRDDFNGGTNGEGSIVWTAPAPGTIDVAGSLWMTRDIGRAVNWTLSHNGTVLTSGAGVLFSGDPFSRANPMPMYAGAGGASALHGLTVAAGDAVALHIVTAPGSPSGDFLGINWAISYTGPVAAAAPVGSGCGGAYVPTLSSSAPVIGGPAALSVAGGTPNVSGAIYFSGVPGGPLPIGGGCIVHLDLSTATQLVPIATNGAGSWSLGFQVPFAPGLAGTAVVLQAVLVPTGGPLGFDLTNGVYALIGF